MKKAYFQYYETFENILEKIKDIEEREHMRKSIINYGLYGTVPAGLYSESMEMAWTICRDLIDQQRHRRETNAENARNRKPAEMTAPAAAPVADAMSEPEEKPKTKKFIKPTVEEVAAFCKEKGYTVNAQTFCNYYEANGWKIGRNSMKSWQAAVQNWNAREKKSGGNIYQNGGDAVAADYSNLF